jgi:hypothetical protein
VRVSAPKFFLTGGRGLAVADDSVIIDCYRLAKYYSTSPEVFLAMPIGDVKTHLERTIELANLMRRESEADG